MFHIIVANLTCENQKECQMNDVQDRSSNNSSRLVVGCMIIFVIAIPFLYALSIGPVAWLVETMGWARGPLRTFYIPLIWLHDHTFLKEPLEWYLGLFGVK